VVTLAFIGFLAGLVTGISPCILPVVPVIFAAGAASGIDEPPVVGNEHRAVEPELVSVGAGEGYGPSLIGATGEGETPSVAETELAEKIERRRRRRPFAIVTGLVISFSVFTLIGTWLLSLLGLPQDALRWIGLVILGLVGIGLIFPVVGTSSSAPSSKWPGESSEAKGEVSSSGSAWASSSSPVPARCWPPSPWSVPPIGSVSRPSS